jgi:hypothetical protein
VNSYQEVAPSAARTADWAARVVNTLGKACHLIVDITAFSAGSVTVTIQGRDPVSGKLYTILASAALAAVATTILRVGPALTAVANLAANDVLPHDLVVDFNHADATSITYSAGLHIVD